MFDRFDGSCTSFLSFIQTTTAKAHGYSGKPSIYDILFGDKVDTY